MQTADSTVMTMDGPKSGPEWCHLVGHHAIDAFVAFVERMAGEQPVTPAQLKAFATKFNAHPVGLDETYEKLWRAAGWTRPGEDMPDRRTAPLQRLLIERFEDILAPYGHAGGEMSDGQYRVNRQVIGGFMSAMATMVPGDLWARARQACVDLIVELQIHNTASELWERMRANADARTHVDDVLMSVLPYFRDFAKRRDWFLGVVDRHQVVPDGPDSHGNLSHATCVMDARAFSAVFALLFEDLFQRRRDDNSLAALVARYGAAAIDDLDRMQANLK